MQENIDALKLPQIHEKQSSAEVEDCFSLSHKPSQTGYIKPIFSKGGLIMAKGKKKKAHQHAANHQSIDTPSPMTKKEQRGVQDSKQ